MKCANALSSDIPADLNHHARNIYGQELSKDCITAINSNIAVDKDMDGCIAKEIDTEGQRAKLFDQNENAMRGVNNDDTRGVNNDETTLFERFERILRWVRLKCFSFGLLVTRYRLYLYLFITE